MKSSLLLGLLLTCQAWSQSLSQSFPAGAGAQYRLKMKDDATPIFLSMYIAGTRVDSVHIEYFMETKGLLPVQMWQQFEVGVGSGGAKLKRGYVLAKELSAAETMPEAYLAGASGGVQVNDFLFASEAQLNKDKIGEETLEIAAGTTKATHYRTTRSGQTIDYWISPSAKPMGLVLLVSKSEKNPQQNYSVELMNLMENVKAKIVPEKAQPLSEKGKALLAKPESLR